VSLKAVHICFIILATGLAVGFGFWALRDYSASKNLTYLILGISSFVIGAALVGYLFWFVVKMKKVGTP
jgi:hypothetical protein